MLHKLSKLHYITLHYFYRRRQTTTTDDDRHRQTPDSKTVLASLLYV